MPVSFVWLLALGVCASKTPATPDSYSAASLAGLTRRQPKTWRPAFQIRDPVYNISPVDYSSGKPYLLQFRGRGDDYCAQMEPLKKQLKQELGIDIRCFEVWYDTTNLELLQKLDRGRCGGVPFFYNKRTRRFICGATTYDNLKAWAMCEMCEPFLPPPNINAPEKQPNDAQNRIQLLMKTMKTKAREKMAQRTDKNA